MSLMSCALGTWPVFSWIRIIDRNRMAGVSLVVERSTTWSNDNRPDRHPIRFPLDLEAVFAEPACGARMQRHVARRGLGLLAERADALVRCPLVEVLPHDLGLARVDRVYDPVGDFFRQVGARIERPGAVVDACVVGVEPAVDAFRHHHAPPADLAELPEDFRPERERPIARGERVLEPEREALVEDRVHCAVGYCAKPALITGPAVELQAA